MSARQPPLLDELETDMDRRRTRPWAQRRFARRVQVEDVWHTESFCGLVLAVEPVPPGKYVALPDGGVEIFVLTEHTTGEPLVISLRHRGDRELLIYREAKPAADKAAAVDDVLRDLDALF